MAVVRQYCLAKASFAALYPLMPGTTVVPSGFMFPEGRRYDSLMRYHHESNDCGSAGGGPVGGDGRIGG